MEWPLRFNITEQDFWAPYDSAIDSSKNKRGNVLDWAVDNAWEDLRQLRGGDCSDILNDLVQAFVPKAKAKKISPDDLDRMCEYFQEDPERFEYSRQAFTDAATWAWEEAYTPEDRDLEKALEYAVDSAFNDFNMPAYWGQILGSDIRGPKDWSPIKRYTEKQLLDEIEHGVSYEHKGDEWDRFIVFDVMSGPAVKDLRNKIQYARDDEGHPLNIPDADFQTDMKDHFVDPVIYYMEKSLDKVMQNVDTHYRVDFRKHWKNVLADKSRAKEIADEILGFLKNNPPEEA